MLAHKPVVDTQLSSFNLSSDGHKGFSMYLLALSRRQILFPSQTTINSYCVYAQQ